MSGKLEYELSSGDPSGIHDFSSTGFLKISSNGKFLAVKQQEFLSGSIHIGIRLYDLSQPTKSYMLLKPNENHKALNSFSFTGDSIGLLMICDSKTVYCFSLDDQTIHYKHIYNDLLAETQLYADNMEAPIYGYTSEYNQYEWDYENILYEENYKCEEDEEDNEVEDDLPIPCRLLKLSVTDGTAEILYSFTGMPRTIPTAKYIPTSSTFLLFNYESMQIEQFSCRTGKIRFLFEDLTKENDMPPSAIHIHPKHPDEYYFMYPDNCYLVNITTSRFSILMRYPIHGVNKLLSDSDQERELQFKTFVVPTNNRFIVGTDTNIYEWNCEEDTLLLKYNIAYYNCTDLIADPQRKQFFLIHQFNGVSVFGGSPLKLINSYCFSDRDYFIGNSCYEPNGQLLALTFSREDHEKIILLNVQTGHHLVCFSSISKNETVTNICFDNSGEWLLIATQYRCLEYQLSSDTHHLILEAANNERIASANYLNKYIEIAIVEDWINGSRPVESRCEFHQRRLWKKNIYYQFAWGYIMPELTDNLAPYFIPQHGDLGITGAKKQNGFQAYWVTRGFFLEKNQLNIPLPECYKMENKKQTHLSKPPVELDFIFYRHTHTVSKYRNDDVGFSYANLSDDDKQAIFLKNSCKLFLHRNYHYCTYEEIEHGFEKNIGSYDGRACWEFAIPWENSDIVACYENFQLLRINSETGLEIQMLEYTPGLAICGCSFLNITADIELKKELKINAAIL